MERLNATLELTLTSSLTSKWNMRNLGFFESRHLFKHVDFIQQIFNFQALSESKGYKFGNSACEKRWVEYVQFLKNKIKRLHSITFYSLEVSKKYIKDQDVN